jgi:probable FeS assembly SUF system protein SufT
MVTSQESIKLVRDIEVVQIPEGFRVRLARGTSVRLMQALGDTFTVMTEYHTMVRVDGKDADAIGQTVSATAPAAKDEKTLTADELKERVWEALRGVYDPEIPVNVVELGLVYKSEVTPSSEGRYRVDIEMTLTAPGCGMGGVLKEDAERRIRQLPQVQDAAVNIVVDPPWNPSMMSESARLELGF